MEQLCLELTKTEVSYLDKVVLDIDKLSVYQFDRMFIDRVADVIYCIEEKQLKYRK